MNKILNFRIVSDNFKDELQRAKNGEESSLPFVINQISLASRLEENDIFQVLVIGGSISKKAILKKTSNGAVIIKKYDQKSINFSSEEEFLEFIEQELEDDISILALNFAYAIKPVFENNKLDGILLKTSRESGFHGFAGKKIGEEIENYIFKKRKKKIKVSVANDTICLLLSGLTKYPWEKLVGGVDGTGVNFAMFLSKNKLVNLESANFDKFPCSEAGKIIDKESSFVGRALFEKETAGEHLYKHFNLKIKSRGLKYPKITSTEELNDISLKNIPQISEIAKDLIKRSAELVACLIAGISIFKGADTVFNMEGSLFWKANNYKETVEETVKMLDPEHKVEFVEIEEAGILGAAKLVA